MSRLGCEANFEFGRYGKLFERAMRFRHGSCLHREKGSAANRPTRSKKGSSLLDLCQIVNFRTCAGFWTPRRSHALQKVADVAAYFGLTSRRWQSGKSIDVNGRISKGAIRMYARAL
jgi:hypothetical protein